jgi:transposase
MDITNEQQQRIAEFIAKPKAQSGKSGRPPQNPRDVLNEILWILRTGSQWAGQIDLRPKALALSVIIRYNRIQDGRNI